jgi:hypothetical protein
MLIKNAALAMHHAKESGHYVDLTSAIACLPKWRGNDKRVRNRDPVSGLFGILCTNRYPGGAPCRSQFQTATALCRKETQADGTVVTTHG